MRREYYGILISSDGYLLFSMINLSITNGVLGSITNQALGELLVFEFY